MLFPVPRDLLAGPTNAFNGSQQHTVRDGGLDYPCPVTLNRKLGMSACLVFSSGLFFPSLLAQSTHRRAHPFALLLEKAEFFFIIATLLFVRDCPWDNAISVLCGTWDFQATAASKGV